MEMGSGSQLSMTQVPGQGGRRIALWTDKETQVAAGGDSELEQLENVALAMPKEGGSHWVERLPTACCSQAMQGMQGWVGIWSH